MMTARRPSRLVVTLVCVVLVLIVGAVVWVSSQNNDSNSSAVTTSSSPPNASKPLSSPTATVAQDANFLADVTQVDPSLSTYEHQSGNVALRSLLTDGSAFCAFLQRDGNMDDAMVSVAVGARSVETRTHLPLSVTTFNSIDSVALLTLCPALHTLVPAPVMSRIRKLGESLALRQN